MRYYVVHRGDECVGVFDSAFQAAKALGVKVDTIRWYSRMGGKRQRGKNMNRKVFVDVEEVVS